MKEHTAAPRMAGATLSGWPSTLVAIATSSSRVTVWPVSAAAAMMPATTQVELEPRPRATGTSVAMSIATPKGFSPHSASAFTSET